MAGTKIGGLKAAAKNLAKDPNFYRKIGLLSSHPGTGGFAAIKRGVDGLTGPERAQKSGKIGGVKSRRLPKKGSRRWREYVRDGKIIPNGKPTESDY